MKILYLYAELMDYQISIFKEYVNNYDAQVHVFHWDNKKLTPYKPPILDNVIYYNKSEYNNNQLKEIVKSINPDIVYISGWQDFDYFSVVYNLRKKGVPVVTGFDDQWRGTLKQRLGAFLFPFTLKRFYSHAWVSGPYQFEYARRMGFEKNKIIFNLLSGNTSLFGQGELHLKIKENNYPKSFLYVGNFRHRKGTDILVKAFKIYREKYNGEWRLTCVGNGEMQSLLENDTKIESIGFTKQEGLIEIAKRSGVFILPSRLDQWGVAVHEFSSLGLPLILSENVGAKAIFLIENFNGISYKNNSPENLAEAMSFISQKKDSELIEMGQRSIQLSKSISPSTSAANFVSIKCK